LFQRKNLKNKEPRNPEEKRDQKLRKMILSRKRPQHQRVRKKSLMRLNQLTQLTPLAQLIQSLMLRTKRAMVQILVLVPMNPQNS